MENSFKALKTRFPAVIFVTAADIAFLKECHIDPGTAPGKDMVVSRASGEIVLAKEICLAFKKIREALQIPLQITGGFRVLADEERIKAQGGHTAKQSPHFYGVALDIAVPRGWTAENFAKYIIRALNGKCRVGWKAYNGTFIHVDVAHILKDKNGKSPDPINYQAGVTW